MIRSILFIFAFIDKNERLEYFYLWFLFDYIGIEMIDKIKSRYSCRNFKEEDNIVKDEDLTQILECGRWAPSGLNNQPWKFIIVKDNPEMQESMANLTHSDAIIRSSAVNVIVLLDDEKIYSKTKDILGIGACIENMLLAAHELGYGTCWLGEILNRAEEVLDLFELDKNQYELMAVISIGIPRGTPSKNREREKLDDLILKSY